jgi:hypothetical protein
MQYIARARLECIAVEGNDQGCVASAVCKKQ